MGTIKKRSTPFYGSNSWDSQQVRGNNTDNVPVYGPRFVDQQSTWAALSGTQVTESENHPGWTRGWHKDFKGAGYRVVNPDDYGGNFTMQRTWSEAALSAEQQVMDSGWYEPYVGASYEVRKRQGCAIVPTSPLNMSFPTNARSSDSTLSSLGTTAIARCAPRNAVMDLAATLFETYHDGIPHILGHSLWESRARKLKEVHSSLGDEYLNVEFGWKPLLSDISDFSHNVTKLNQVYSQYARDSGKVVRRRYEFPSTEKTTETTFANNVGATLVANVSNKRWYLDQIIGLGKVTLTNTTYKRQWFSGAFTYYVPPLGDSFVDHANRAIGTLGLDLNPESLWELAPWSWAVDWFTNVGDIIHNVNSWSSDGLVLKYGYIMEHSISKNTYAWSGDPRLLPKGLFPLPVTLCCETKLRRRATPFGFGLSGLLTNRQKAIAAALGLSRV